MSEGNLYQIVTESVEGFMKYVENSRRGVMNQHGWKQEITDNLQWKSPMPYLYKDTWKRLFVVQC